MRNGLIEEVTRDAGQNDQEDGIHFKAAFYPVWAEHMAEVASL